MFCSTFDIFILKILIYLSKIRQDYLGNNRAVIKGWSGAIEQTVACYPYRGVISDLGNPTGGQPYKFGGKELITANGLNEYDFGARRYYLSQCFDLELKNFTISVKVSSLKVTGPCCPPSTVMNLSSFPAFFNSSEKNTP